MCSALPLSDLSGTTCETQIATGDETNHRTVQLRPGQLAHGVATRRPVGQLALGFVRPHLFVRNYIRRQELAKGMGRS